MFNVTPVLGFAEETGTPELWLVREFNHLFGSAILAIERVILPPLYGVFGAKWTAPASADNVVPGHVVMALIAFVIVIALAYLMRGKLSVDRPKPGQQMLEITVSGIRDLLDQVIGAYGRRYEVFIGTIALFILVANLMGLIPGLEAPSTNINFTGALGLASFLYYMSRGFRQQGLGYLKHFTGGLTNGLWLIMGVMIFFIELLSNCVRPVTLSVRLLVNMFADHQIATVFLSLTPWLVPVLTLVLGAFVAIVQTFIFIMLSMVYLSETVPHEHEEESGHGHAAVAEA
ncbi:MAG TPA: F0F1 ATP synthase subunit A [Blastocatellia bacterium]|nr:F0F1 ATP synthase subunit A [Blastocatellia bacterium]